MGHNLLGRWVPEGNLMRALASLLALSLVALPTAAFAHTGVGDAHGFLHGFEHPIGGIDHILAMVAVGVFAFVLGGRALWLVPLSFVGMMAVGFLLGVGQIEVQGEGAPPERTDLSFDLERGALIRVIRDGHVCAGAGRGEGNRPPDSAGRAGHEQGAPG